MGTLAADYLLANFNTTGRGDRDGHHHRAFTLSRVQFLYVETGILARRTDGVSEAAWEPFESWRDIRRQKRMELYRARAEQARLRAEEKQEKKHGALDSNRSQSPR